MNIIIIDYRCIYYYTYYICIVRFNSAGTHIQLIFCDKSHAIQKGDLHSMHCTHYIILYIIIHLASRVQKLHDNSYRIMKKKLA